MIRIAMSLAIAMAVGGTAACGGSVPVANVVENAPDGEWQAPTITASPTLDPDRELRSLTVAGSGDILIHPSLWGLAQSYDSGSGPDFAPLLSGVRTRVRSADLAICHDETQFSDPQGPITSFPHYYVHPRLADAIAQTGFDECSLASNWSFDKGIDGVRRTIAALNAQDVQTAGTQARKADPRFVIRKANGVSYAHISATDPSDSPGISGAPWAINRQTPAEIAADAAQARSQGAEIVIVSLAMGPMGATGSTPEQKAAVRAITADGNVDLVIGHGSHTVQPAERVNGTWVIWHGNLLASFFDDQPRMHEGLVSVTTFEERPEGGFDAKARAYPVLMQRPELIDLAAQDCTAVPYRWTEAYDAIAAVERRAMRQGLTLVEPCAG